MALSTEIMDFLVSELNDPHQQSSCIIALLGAVHLIDPYVSDSFQPTRQARTVLLAWVTMPRAMHEVQDGQTIWAEAHQTGQQALN
jgi:hypothetical protein